MSGILTHLCAKCHVMCRFMQNLDKNMIFAKGIIRVVLNWIDQDLI